MKLGKLSDEVKHAYRDVQITRKATLTRTSKPVQDRFRGIPSHAEIKELLDRGLDSYRICQRLGCRAVDVLNVVRLYNGLKPMADEPYIPPDSQTTDPTIRSQLIPPTGNNNETQHQ